MDNQVTKVSLVRPFYPSIWEALNLGYLASSIKANIPDVEVDFYDGFFESEEEIVKGCSDSDFVGFTCTTPQTENAFLLAEEIKRVNPSVETVFGGYDPSARPEYIYAHPVVDNVVVGEGEKAICGIISLKSKGIIKAEPILDLDSLPWPDRDLIRVDRTTELTLKNDGERITSAQGGRGCPFSCTFCTDRLVNTQKIRRRTPGLLLDEIEYVVKKYNIDHIKFCDAEINPNLSWVKQLCRETIERNIDVSFGANIHAAVCDLEMFELMKEAGFRDVWIGAESGSPGILKSINKGITVDLVKRAFSLSKEAGLIRRAYFIAGLPGETSEDWKRTLKLAEEIDAEVLGCTLLAPYPNSDIYNEHKDWLNLEDVSWSSVDEYSNDIWHYAPYYSNDMLKSRQREFMEKFEDKLTWRHKIDEER